MLDGLVFGWRTAVLSVAVVQMLLLAVALLRPLKNRPANRTLSLLLVVLSGVVAPWMIGFAGFYDRWRWLTFAPFALTLAVPPLIYLYARALVDQDWPPRTWRHFIPVSVQALFLIGSFALPMGLKAHWDDMASGSYTVITGAGVLIGLLAYGRAGLALLARYRTLLASQRSDDHRFAAAWLSRAISATLVLLPIWAGYVIWDAIAPLGYSGLMGLYIAIAAFGLFIGIEGWRHAALPFPPMASLPVDKAPVPPRDWAAQGQAWASETRAQGWHTDPDLSLSTLARRLGTNTGHLSRAVNEGLGMNFSSFIGGLRCEMVAAALAAGSNRDLLNLALDAGFSSKASFNRAFRQRFGTSPSGYRRAHGSNRE